ncbi:MAG TPA: plastocyanin/azurin family copper-binding protein, partial [Bacteroidota bacterium]|nr:plastocyanin/azurin family copper-binding protein [Bacteroidota bacterium]
MKIVFVLICSLTIFTTIVWGTTHTISSSGFTFSPNTLTITAGDTINFVLASIHNAVEVSQATWNADGITSNGGFSVPFGGGKTVLTVVGTHYYVCQNHASMGMKGIITVNPSAPPPNSISVESIYDHDGNLSTTNDRVPKNWALKLYKDSVGSGIVVDSVNSSTSFTANNLSAGTYVAWEADSASWSHIS